MKQQTVPQIRIQKKCKHEKKHKNHLVRLGVPDAFIQHGTRMELLDEIGLTPDNIIHVLKKTMPEEIYDY